MPFGFVLLVRCVVTKLGHAVTALLVLEQFDATCKIDEEGQYGTEQSHGDGANQDDRLDVD